MIQACKEREKVEAEIMIVWHLFSSIQQKKILSYHLDLLQIHQTIPISVPELGELLSLTSYPVGL